MEEAEPKVSDSVSTMDVEESSPMQSPMVAKISWKDSHHKSHNFDIELPNVNKNRKPSSSKESSPKAASKKPKIVSPLKSVTIRSPNKSLKILNKYKRQEMAKYKPVVVKAPDPPIESSDDDLLVERIPAPTSTFDNKLEKLGTIVKKIKAPTTTFSIPSISSVKTVDLTPPYIFPETMSSRTTIPKQPEFVRLLPPLSTGNQGGFKKPSLLNKSLLVHNILRRASVSCISDLKQTDSGLKFTTSPRTFLPPRAASTFTKIRLQKNLDGKYTVVQTPIVKPTTPSPPKKFPHAISYPSYETLKAKQLQQAKQVPEASTSKAVTIAPKTIIRTEQKDLLDISRPTHIVKSTISPKDSPPRPPMEDQFVIASDDDDDEEEEVEPIEVAPVMKTGLRMRPLHELQDREPEPQPVKYIIPQDMLFDSDAKIKKVEKEPTQHPSSPVDYDNSNLFVIDEDDDKKPAESSLSKNRRKSVLVPRKDDQEDLFDEPPFQIPPRPQANIDLIENLANYRVLVQNMLKKLNMPKMDFNEDGDEYINVYKIFRN